MCACNFTHSHHTFVVVVHQYLFQLIIIVTFRCIMPYHLTMAYQSPKWDVKGRKLDKLIKHIVKGIEEARAQREEEMQERRMWVQKINRLIAEKKERMKQEEQQKKQQAATGAPDDL